MEPWLEWTRGPLFRFALAVLVLGLIRLVVLNGINLISLVRRSQDKKVPGGAVARDMLKWLFPLTRVPASQRFFTLVSVAFHLCTIIVPIFLAGHILLWQRGLGLSWPSVDQTVADYMTLLAIAAGLWLFGKRVSTPLTRSLSRAQDYLLPLIIVATFVSGYLAVHPTVNPVGYDATMLVHTLSGDLVLILIPFSKLSHMLLLPINHVVSELGWHLVPDSGARVALALGKEGERV